MERAAAGSKFTPDLLNEVIFGNCLMAGQGAGPVQALPDFAQHVENLPWLKGHTNQQQPTC